MCIKGNGMILIAILYFIGVPRFTLCYKQAFQRFLTRKMTKWLIPKLLISGLTLGFIIISLLKCPVGVRWQSLTNRRRRVHVTLHLDKVNCEMAPSRKLLFLRPGSTATLIWTLDIYHVMLHIIESWITFTVSKAK